MSEGKQAMLDRIEAALEQAQDCIRGETPEDISDEEAREDTISKIRAALFDDIPALRASASGDAQGCVKPTAWMSREHVEAYRAGTPGGIAWASPEQTEFYDTALYAAPAQGWRQYGMGALAKYLYENCALDPDRAGEIAAEILSDYDVKPKDHTPLVSSTERGTP